MISRLWWRAGLPFAIAVIALVAVFQNAANNTGSGNTPDKAVATSSVPTDTGAYDPGHPEVPDFTLATSDGGSFTLSAAKGKHPVLINFFATWCPGCNMEYPHLQKVYKEYKDRGLEIVSISSEPPGLLEKFKATQKTTFPILVDSSQRTTAAYGADSIPANILVDKDGRLVDSLMGYSEEEFQKHIVSHLPDLLKDEPQRQSKL